MIKIQSTKYSARAVIASLMLMTALATPACVSKVNNGGYVNDADIKSEIMVGQTTRDQVEELMGSPSSKSSFGNEVWYYISDRLESTAFLKPEVTGQHVTRIEFGPTGVVSSVEEMGLKDSKDFDLAKRTTPTEGHSMGFMEQLLGNVGRFNNTNQRRPGAGVPGAPGGM